MKKIFILSLIVTLTMNVYAQNERLQHLGLISELVYIKYSSEAIANTAFDSLKLNLVDTTLISLYYTTRIMVDQMVLQLEADMKVNNSIRYYKQLDKLLTKNILSDLDMDQGNGKIISYKIGLFQINQAYNNLLTYYKKKKFGSNEKEVTDKKKSGFDDKGLTNLISTSIIPTVTDMIPLWNAINTIITQHTEAKAKKVTAICTILDSLRLIAK